MKKIASEKIVVYTALAGSGRDSVVDPIPAPNVDYFCFTDQPIVSQVWQVRPFTWVHPQQNVRTAKHPKVLPHRYFPDHQLSIWVDANITPGPDIVRVARYYLRHHDMALHRHPWRNCLFQEAALVSRIKKDYPDLVAKVIKKYRRAGIPEGFGLCECNVLFRRHNDPVVKQFMEAWWQEISAGSNSDQTSFAFLWWKLGIVPQIIDGNVRESPFFNYRPHNRIAWGERPEPSGKGKVKPVQQVSSCL